MCKLTAAAISYYERGKRKPCMAALLALSKALGCTVEELVGAASA
nr:MAG TPA: SOS-response transcriptional repressor [Caudoviricetes sp.]